MNNILPCLPFFMRAVSYMKKTGLNQADKNKLDKGLEISYYIAELVVCY